MNDKESAFKKAEDKIKDAAKAVEEFADKVSASEEPVVILPEDEARSPNLPPDSKKHGQS